MSSIAAMVRSFNSCFDATRMWRNTERELGGETLDEIEPRTAAPAIDLPISLSGWAPTRSTSTASLSKCSLSNRPRELCPGLRRTGGFRLDRFGRRGSPPPHGFFHPGDEGAAGSLGRFIWLWPWLANQGRSRMTDASMSRHRAAGVNARQPLAQVRVPGDRRPAVSTHWCRSELFAFTRRKPRPLGAAGAYAPQACRKRPSCLR